MSETKTLNEVSVGDEVQIIQSKDIEGSNYLGKIGTITKIFKKRSYPYYVNIEGSLILLKVTEFDLLSKSDTFIKTSQPKLKRILALKRHKGK